MPTFATAYAENTKNFFCLFIVADLSFECQRNQRVS